MGRGLHASHESETGFPAEFSGEDPDTFLHSLLREHRSSRTGEINRDEQARMDWACAESREIAHYLGRDSATIVTMHQAADTAERQFLDRHVDKSMREEWTDRLERIIESIENTCDHYTQEMYAFQRDNGIGESDTMRAQRIRVFEEFDTVRHQTHDALIALLERYNVVLKKLERDYGLHFESYMRFPEEMIIRKGAQESLARARSLASEWALSTDYFLKVQKMKREMHGENRKSA